jgi:hypothetical protein
MSQQQVTALCLLDLSAAFDTIDRYILQYHSSTWFGFNGKLIFWLTSYLSCRSFVVLSTQLHLLILLSVRVSRRDQSSVLSYSFSVQLLLVLSYLTFPLVIICMLMTINFSFLLSSLNFPPKLLTCKPQVILSLSECFPICCH